MKLQKTNIRFATAVAAVAIFCELQTSDAKQPSVLNVNVENTPLPVTVENAVSVTGSVTVQNPTTSVTIQNTPNVNVANIPSVKSADNPAFQPYIKSGSHFNQAGISDSIAFDVPAGKRLVIELITVSLDLPAGQNQSSDQLLLNEGLAQQVTHELTPTAIGDVGSGDVGFSTTQSLRAYAEAGNGTVKIHVGRNTNAGTFSFSVSVSGYLVDIP
jgi:hypothetical protein